MEARAVRRVQGSFRAAGSDQGRLLPRVYWVLVYSIV